MTAKALIRWLPPERGGRKSPPTGQYRAVSRFEDSRDRWPEAVWSIVVDPVRSVGDQNLAILAEVQFLMPEAPSELLTEGARFELCEGYRVVAKGVVLPESIAVPQQIDEFALSLMGG